MRKRNNLEENAHSRQGKLLPANLSIFRAGKSLLDTALSPSEDVYLAYTHIFLYILGSGQAVARQLEHFQSWQKPRTLLYCEEAYNWIQVDTGVQIKSCCPTTSVLSGLAKASHIALL